MKTSTLFYLSILSLALSSCSCSSNKERQAQYPSNPTNGQVYVDPSGNQSVWNSALQCWMIYSMLNGQQVVNRYYPASDSYKDQNNQPISRPAYIPVSSKSSSISTSSKSVSTSKPTSTPTRKAGFGSTGKGHSIGS